MTPSVPPDLLDHVVRRLDPVAVYLFGSRARGTAGPDSDIDLFVVLDDEAQPPRDVAATRVESWRLGHGHVDIVSSRRSRFSRCSRLPGTFDEAVVREGVELYAREHPVAIEGEVGGVEEPIKEWLERARTDLKAVGLMVDDEDMLFNAAVLLQQALEKVLKAELIGLAVPTWKSHDLPELAAGGGTDLRARVAHLDLGKISKWAVGPRYPDPDPPPQYVDVRAAHPAILAYYEEARARLLPGA